MERLSRIVPLFVELAVFLALAVGAHEQGHYVAALTQGIHGHVIFSALGGFFVYQDPTTGAIIQLTAQQDLIIGLFGGMGVGLLFLVLGAVNYWQGRYEPGALDETFIFTTLGIAQIVYGVGEGIAWWIPSAPTWTQPLGLIMALTVGLAISGKRLMDWIVPVFTAPTSAQVDESIPATNIQEEP